MQKLTLVALTLSLLFYGSAYAAGWLPLAGPGQALTPCVSTGIYDLSNTCNDIYFIGALK